MAPQTRCDLWGWSARSRYALAALALVLALALTGVTPRRGAATVAAPALVVDPNTVPLQVFPALPRLGPALADRIAAERDRRPFRSPGDLGARVRGVGPATVEALRPYLRFGTATRPLTPRAEPGAP